MLQTAQNDNYRAKQQRPLSSTETARQAQLTALRDRIKKLEYSSETELEEQVSAGTHSKNTPIFPASHSHEVWAASPWDYGATMGFAIRTAAVTDKPILWITTQSMAREHGLPYGPGLLTEGLDPSKFILIRCKHEQDALWAMEEGLKTTALSAVIGELTDIDLNSSRRLSLACRAHGSRMILLLRREQAASSACYSRWQITPSASNAPPFAPNAPGATRLEANLVKHRAGMRPAATIMEWQDAPDRFSVATPLADRTLDAQLKTQHATG